MGLGGRGTGDDAVVKVLRMRRGLLSFLFPLENEVSWQRPKNRTVHKDGRYCCSGSKWAKDSESSSRCRIRQWCGQTAN